jgi:Protein of unknown function (DUF3047)
MTYRHTARSGLARGLSTAGMIAGRLAQRSKIAAEIIGASTTDGPEPPAGTTTGRRQLTLKAGEAWQNSGVAVRADQAFTVRASGPLWLQKGLALGFEPRLVVWVRIDGQLRKLISNETSFIAWTDGPVEVMVKDFRPWSDSCGNQANAAPGGTVEGAIEVLVAAWAADVPPGFAAPAGNGAPEGWIYHQQTGDAGIYRPQPDGSILIDTRGDAGILTKAVDVELGPQTTISWDWLVEVLPSSRLEDIAAHHDYLSVAAEFDNGLDLTWMWSAGLPTECVFQCPLPYWCDLETHLVVRSDPADIGRWCHEERNVAADYARSIGGPMPKRIVRLWLIAASVFQRQPGRALIKDLIVS